MGVDVIGDDAHVVDVRIDGGDIGQGDVVPIEDSLVLTSILIPPRTFKLVAIGILLFLALLSPWRP